MVVVCVCLGRMKGCLFWRCIFWSYVGGFVCMFGVRVEGVSGGISGLCVFIRVKGGGVRCNWFGLGWDGYWCIFFRFCV